MERAKLGETDMLVSRLSFGGPFEEPFGCALARPDYRGAGTAS